jgi:hypothetical protein
MIFDLIRSFFSDMYLLSPSIFLICQFDVISRVQYHYLSVSIFWPSKRNGDFLGKNDDLDRI